MLDLDQHIWQCLDLDLLEGALFAAEQFYTQKPCDESRYLHGIVLYRLGRYKSAQKVLEGERYLPSAFVYAQCALKLEDPSSGLDSLQLAKPWIPIPGRGSPSRAAIHLLMGKLQNALEDKTGAAVSLAQSAKLDPYLVEHVTTLVSIPGFKVEIDPLFSEQSEDTTSVFGLGNTHKSPLNIPRTPLLINRRTSCGSGNNNHGTPLRIPSSGPFSGQLSGQLQRPQHQLDTPLQPPNRGYRNITPTPLKTPEHPQLPMAPRRRKFTRRPLDSDDSFLSPSSLFEPDKPPAVVQRPAGTEREVTIQSIYQIYFTACKLLSKYEIRQCLEQLDKLPQQHQDTPTFLALAARCHSELLDYEKSAETYGQLRAVDPYRTHDMDNFSTVLWQLKREADLGFLAHELTAVDREAWQTWCVVGNSFSLQNDITNALECFKRATQLNSKCAPAFSLQGHEYMLNEEHQTAIDAFRAAIAADSGSYGAWFGLSMVYFRLEQVDAAERHVAQALRINPNNPAMLSYLGVIYNEKGETSKSLLLYRRACQLQPDYFAGRYHMASALIKQEKYQEALEELEYLRKKAPKDADVQFTLGKLHCAINNVQLGIKHLTAAMSLDSRFSPQVKQHLHSLGV